MPRGKIEVVVYDFKGKFLEEFDSLRKFREAYYPNDVSNRPLFRTTAKGVKYELLENGIAFQERVGRDKVLMTVDIINSPYCKRSDDNDPVIEVYNLEDKKIAEFDSLRLLTKMMPHINPTTIFYSLRNEEPLRKRGAIGLKFRYKKSE